MPGNCVVSISQPQTVDFKGRKFKPLLTTCEQCQSGRQLRSWLAIKLAGGEPGAGEHAGEREKYSHTHIVRKRESTDCGRRELESLSACEDSRGLTAL